MLNLINRLLGRQWTRRVNLSADSMTLLLEGDGGDHLWRADPADWRRALTKDATGIHLRQNRYISLGNFYQWCLHNHINPRI